MKKLYWEHIGTGNINLILLHGWGLNMKIWNNILFKLYKKFKIYLIDLPGYGKNNHFSSMNIDETAHMLFSYMPKDSIWLGWSMGGLIVTKIALYYQKYTRAIINVASSPCFVIKPEWPGIKIKTLQKFYNQLNYNYINTVKKFIDDQTLNINHIDSCNDFLKNLVLSEPHPKMSTLKKGLKMIASIDLRVDLLNIKIPNLYICGALDTLIPKKLVTILKNKYFNSTVILMKKSGHAPFISEPKKFCDILLTFKKTLAP